MLRSTVMATNRSLAADGTPEVIVCAPAPIAIVVAEVSRGLAASPVTYIPVANVPAAPLRELIVIVPAVVSAFPVVE